MEMKSLRWKRKICQESDRVHRSSQQINHLERDVLDLYNSFKGITSSEHEWTTLTFMYEKKNEDISEPLTVFGVWIEGDVLDLYNSFKVITSSEHEWTTLTFMYEKKNEDISEPLTVFGVWIDVIKETDGYLFKK
uniref:Bet v I/Major latex protein domain-containing protein n=1 Tax=Solanum lycopersicum TaxID=4081 RepID=A0A3Q7GNU9_SOLLC